MKFLKSPLVMTMQKASNSVYAKVSYLCAGILNSAFSQATDVFEK